VTTQLAVNTDRRDDGTFVLIAAGELDLSNVEAFTRALTDAIDVASRAAAAITVDFSDIEYMDSSGINVLFTHAGRIRGLIINPLLSSVVTYSGLNELVPVEQPARRLPPNEDQP
jgi:anti-anti-sigma factor